MESDLKKCRACQQEKPKTEFYKGRRKCKACNRERQKAYRETDRARQIIHEYRNKPEVKAKAKEYRQEYQRRPEVKAIAREKAKTPERKNAPSQRKKWGESMYNFLRIDANDY